MEVDRDLLVRVTVVHRPTEWSPLDLLDHLASCVKDNERTASLVSPDIEPVVHRLHGHQQAFLIIEELMDVAQLGVMHMGHLAAHRGVSVNILNRVSPMVRANEETFLIVIVELNGKLARLKSTDHLAEGVVRISLLAPSHHEASLVVGDKLKVAKLDNPIPTVISECNPLALLRHRDNIAVDVVGVNPA